MGAQGGCDAADAMCARRWMDANLRLNDLLVVGTHNSYKQAIPDAVMALIRAAQPQDANGLDYRHRPLSEQLDAGARQLEIDVYHDRPAWRLIRRGARRWPSRGSR